MTEKMQGVVKVKMYYYNCCKSFVAPNTNDYHNAKIN